MVNGAGVLSAANREDGKRLWQVRLQGSHSGSLVIAGENDALMPREIHQELAQGIPGATLTVIPHCGHLAPLERPAEVAAALRALLLAVA